MSLSIDLPDDVGLSLRAKAEQRGVSPSDLVREGLRLLEQKEREEHERLLWLREAAQEGFADLERGDYAILESEEETGAFVQRVRDEVLRELAAEREVE